MAQAAIRLITSDGGAEPPRQPPQGPTGSDNWQARFASAYADLEGPFADMRAMAEISTDVVSKLFSAPRDETQPHCFFIPDREREHALFAVFHLAAMIEREKRKLDKALEE
jgi:hypothetical protein